MSHMADFDSELRAPDQRLPGSVQAPPDSSLSDTLILDAAQNHPGGTVMVALDGVERPVFGRFQIEKLLGRGAVGAVYLGRDPADGRMAAIKIMALPRESATDGGAGELREVKARFFREARSVSQFRHPAIVDILDIGEAHGFVYIAMEFMPNGDLARHVAADSLLSLPRTLSIVAQIAEALSYVHVRGVVHRDIKPANIMCAAAGDVVKLSDFGIAHIAGGKAATAAGTPHYMSPEQLCGQDLDGRSDLFSLGVTLYQLSCGRLPFQGDSLAQLMSRIASEPHADILTCNPALPPFLAEIVDRALAKRLQERYQSGREMAHALRSSLSGAAFAKKTGSADIIHGRGESW